MSENRNAGIHEEFVLVLQGASSLYRTGSDRINNAESYCRKHAEAMQDFDSKELHPDTCRLYRQIAKSTVALQACLTDKNATAYRNSEYAFRRLDAINETVRLAIAKAKGQP